MEHRPREDGGAALSSNMKAAGEEFAHLKEQSANASADAKARLAPRMEQLKAEWSKNREKLAAHLEADLKETKEEMEKLGAETSNTAKIAKEKLVKKYHDLRGAERRAGQGEVDRGIEMTARRDGTEEDGRVAPGITPPERPGPFLTVV